MSTDDTVQDKTAHDETLHDETLRDESAGGETRHGESAGGETLHGETAQDWTAQDETAHGGTAHDETAHGATAQDQTAQRREATERLVAGWAEVPPVIAAGRVPLSADGRPIGRPAPQYGEYAPEGWVNPLLADASSREAASTSVETAQSGVAGPRDARSIGGGWAAGGGGDRPRASGTNPWPPDTSAPGPAHQTPWQTGREARVGSGGRVRRPASRSDVVFTAILLGIGLTSVLQQLIDVPAVAANVAQTLARQYVALDHPEALVPAAAWCGVGQAAVFVVAVWWSVRRIRRGRRAVWIPFAAGALTTIASGLVYFAVALHDPAFAAWFAAHGGQS